MSYNVAYPELGLGVMYANGLGVKQHDALAA